MITEILLQRQGVSRTLRQWFLPCPHGKRWYIEFVGLGGLEVYRAELSYPGCPDCFGPKSSRVAWNNRVLSSRQEKSLASAKAEAVEGISRMIGADVVFSEKVEAYRCYSDAEYQIYPHLKNDVFLATCYYNVDQDVISPMAEAEGMVVLVTFSKGTARACYSPFGPETSNDLRKAKS